MTRAELDILVGWASKEGWNPGLHDAAIFWETDPDGFIAAELNGELIGGGSIVSYQGEFGFMGFFIIKPEYRGRGLGTRLWFARRDQLQSRLNSGAAIGMDGVFEMQPFYARGGFKFAHREIRYEGVGQVNGLSSHAVGEPVFIDVPEVNHNAMKLVSDKGMVEAFGCARMYFASVPTLPDAQIYGVTTFELG